jgi:hypothetical protein
VCPGAILFTTLHDRGLGHLLKYPPNLYWEVQNRITAACRTDRVILGLCRPSRRWRMASLSIIFTAISAVI